MAAAQALAAFEEVTADPFPESLQREGPAGGAPEPPQQGDHRRVETLLDGPRRFAPLMTRVIEGGATLDDLLADDAALRDSWRRMRGRVHSRARAEWATTAIQRGTDNQARVRGAGTARSRRRSSRTSRAAT